VCGSDVGALEGDLEGEFEGGRIGQWWSADPAGLRKVGIYEEKRLFESVGFAASEKGFAHVAGLRT